MKNSQTLTLSKKKFTFPILDSIAAEIEVLENPYRLPIQELFTMAARINKKRAFLFVSKVLGKHLPIKPHQGLLTASLLAARYLEEVKGMEEAAETERLTQAFLKSAPVKLYPFIPPSINPVVIGFAETATALGHAFFDCFQQADFFHTTREKIRNHQPEITFEEEHSHATSHRCYIPLEMIRNQREIILVDDEMTTGKTALNIIQSIHARFPRSNYSVVSILDWRSEDDRNKFLRLEQELGITIRTVSLMSGDAKIKNLKEITNRSDIVDKDESWNSDVKFISLSKLFHQTAYSAETSIAAPYIKETGRFGLSSTENRLLHQKVVEAAEYLQAIRVGQRTLCLGTGEFMYLSMKIAAEMGRGVFYQSTTRSPIYIENQEGYGARYGISFPNPEDLNISHHVYNIPPGYYDDIFLFFEREIEVDALRPLLKELEKIKVHSVKVVFFSNGEVRTHADH